jgi:anaphase-promoting complex subunit 4
MKWFKGEVELQGLEIGSERREELSAQRADEIDVRAILGYVDGGLARSNVLDFLRGGSKDDKSAFMGQEDVEEGQSQFYQWYKNIRRKAIEKETTRDAQLPKMDELVVKLKGQCAKVFDQIATTLKTSIRQSHVATLGSDCGPEGVAMRVVAGEPASETTLAYEVSIATKASKSPQKVLLTKFESTGSTGAPHQASQVTMEYDGEVVDFQFTDDADFMVLVAGDDGSSIYRCAGADPITALVHRFDRQPPQSRPRKLEINGRKGRRVVCVLDQDGMRYEIFDVDGAGGYDGDEGKGVEMDGSSQ